MRRAYLHVAQLGRVVQQVLDALVELPVVIGLNVQDEVCVRHAHVALEGQVKRPEECHGDAAECDRAPNPSAVLGVARGAHAEHRPPHVLLCFLFRQCPQRLHTQEAGQ